MARQHHGRMRAPPAMVALAAALLMMVASPAHAYPSFWAALSNGCDDSHPNSKQGGHGAPKEDGTIAFTVEDAKGAPVTALCAGGSYTVMVSTPQARNVLLTASQGALSGGYTMEGLPTCAKRVYSDDSGEARSHTFNYKAPTSAAGAATVQLKATTATGDAGRFLQASSSLPLQAAGACGAAAKPAAMAAKPAATAKKAAAKAAATVAVTKAASKEPAAHADKHERHERHERHAHAKQAMVAEAAASPAAAAAAVGACTPSVLGYQCQVDTPAGATLHYSVGGPLPDNACTRGTTAAGPNANAAPDRMLHMAMVHDAQGYMGLSFPREVGRMSPADSVIGYTDSNGMPAVVTHTLQGHKKGEETTASNWAVNRGFVRTAGAATLCFSRPMDSAVNMAVHKSLDPAAIPINYAASSSNSLLRSHSFDGGMVLDTTAGTVGGQMSGGTDPLMIAHGVLMLAAFGGLMPLGVIMARHKWLAGQRQGGISPAWFVTHASVQATAVLAAIAGIALAFVAAGTEDPGHAGWKAHQVIGLLTVAMAFVQLAIGIFRPAIQAPKRAAWHGLHAGWGSAVLLLGWANLILGSLLFHETDGEPYSVWVTAAVVLEGVMILAFLGLEGVKAKLEREGRYNPKTHEYSHTPLPTKGASSGGADPAAAACHVSDASCSETSYDAHILAEAAPEGKAK